MDVLLKRRIALSAMTKRKNEIDLYVEALLLEEITGEALVAGIQRIKAEEKARVHAEDELAAGERINTKMEDAVELTPC